MKAKKIYGIYLIQHQLDGRAYVGQGDIYTRWENHIKLLNSKKHHSLKLQNYFNKNGTKNLYFHILMECSEEEMDFWEKWWIKSLDTYKNGFNMTEGGKDPPHKKVEPFKLKNIETGEELSFTTQRSAARQLNLFDTAVSALVSGKANYSGAWYNPNGKWKPKYHTVISPEGQKYTFSNVVDFAKKQNMLAVGFYSLVRKRIDYNHGWHREDSNPNRRREALNKHKVFNKYKLISPSGQVFEGQNVNGFAREHDIPMWIAHELVNNKRDSYKGWTKA